MTRLFVVTGLEAEARIVRAAFRRGDPSQIDIACAAMRAERAQALTAAAIRQGAEAVVSFGLCGALAPGLRPGSLVIAERVVTVHGDSFATDPALRARLLGALAPALEGCLLGVDAPVRGATEKHALAAQFQASAVDMESHGVLRAAREAAVPALVLRAVADPAERSVPPAALAGAGPQGELRPLAVVGALARRPWDLPAVVRLAADTRRAKATLTAAAACLADLFGRD